MAWAGVVPFLSLSRDATRRRSAIHGSPYPSTLLRLSPAGLIQPAASRHHCPTTQQRLMAGADAHSCPRLPSLISAQLRLFLTLHPALLLLSETQAGAGAARLIPRLHSLRSNTFGGLYTTACCRLHRKTQAGRARHSLFQTTAPSPPYDTPQLRPDA